RTKDYLWIKKRQFPINENNYLFLALCLRDQENMLYLIPSTAWNSQNDLFRDRPYNKPGQTSEPEWGMDFTKKSIPLLEAFRFDTIAPSLLDA
ncbi:MAG: DUF4365 domain-containing protein, partial [Verrucomicrobiota bacterium]